MPSEPSLPDLLDEGLTLFAAQVRAITDADWSRPTPCVGWDVRALVSHVVTTMTVGARILSGDVNGAEPGPLPRDPGEVADRVDELARGFRTALAGADLAAVRDTPMGPRTATEGLGFPIVDLAVHSWDLGTALGRPLELPPRLLRHAHDFSHAAPVAVLRNPRAFGPQVEAAEGASPTEALMAFLGRRA